MKKKWTCLPSKFLYCDVRENHSSDRFIGRTSLTFQADFSIIDLKKQTNKNKKTRQFWQNIMTNFVQNIIVCKFTKHLDSVDGSLSGKTAFFSNILLKWYMFICSYNPKNGSWDSIDIIVCQISRQWELKQERL